MIGSRGGMRHHVYTNRDQRSLGKIIPDLIKGRELLLDLISKNLRVRYRYAVMGFLWAILEPIALMFILTFIFSMVLRDKAATAGAGAPHPYPVVVLCGLIFWQCFAASVQGATQSLIDNRNLVTKVAFPREVIPLSSIGYPVINLLIGFIILVAVHFFFGGSMTLAWLWFPVLFGVQVLLIAGLALLLSCANVHYRDVGYMVSVGLIFGFYATPVFYELDVVTDSAHLPQWAKVLYECNPMAGLITGYRGLLFEHQLPALYLLLWPLCFALLVLAAGAVLFRRMAPTLSDYL